MPNFTFHGLFVHGFFALSVAPWGVVWCYLGIVMLSNEVLHRREPAAPESWMNRLVGKGPGER